MGRGTNGGQGFAMENPCLPAGWARRRRVRFPPPRAPWGSPGRLRARVRPGLELALRLEAERARAVVGIDLLQMTRGREALGRRHDQWATNLSRSAAESPAKSSDGSVTVRVIATTFSATFRRSDS
jgi:hypothetical protein